MLLVVVGDHKGTSERVGYTTLGSTAGEVGGVLRGRDGGNFWLSYYGVSLLS